MAADKPRWTEPPLKAVTMGIVRRRSVLSIELHNAGRKVCAQNVARRDRNSARRRVKEAIAALVDRV